MIIEICANSYQSALNAQSAGADRIELCSELAIGGITPSYGLIKQVVDELTIPVFVLIRPRSGNFTYTDEEFEIMKTDISISKELGCHGIVSGILTNDFEIDLDRTKELIELSHPLPFTFHRAFDWVKSPVESLAQLTKLEVTRILTSGQETSAEKGIATLAQLNQLFQKNLIILPGGGINLTNCLLFKKAGFTEIHGSFSSLTPVNQEPPISMNSQKHFDETLSAVSDTKQINQLVKLLKDED